ncbi:hypothetical protein PX554_11870 [Sphingomonas sp. H39-1-10]|uniref:hypothetical protein n=1 Tax=Sphingomonas pollutisoli TaxID=3030829 RepID=UPI0023B8C86A|nr:hypothetical protein [Sphingomonas pollutisoli]MDF0488829.1 hypothetical protein [Sphingomonas pollutisoli]
MTPIATILRGKGQMLRISAGKIDGKPVIDMALLPLDGSDPNPRKGLAIELATLPSLVTALAMAAEALEEGSI